MLPFIFHTPSNLWNLKLNNICRKPPKQLLVVRIIFLIQGTLPVGTQTNPFIEHKTNHNHIFLLLQYFLYFLLPCQVPPSCGVNLQPRLSYLCTNPLIFILASAIHSMEVISLSPLCVLLCIKLLQTESCLKSQKLHPDSNCKHSLNFMCHAHKPNATRWPNYGWSNLNHLRECIHVVFSVYVSRVRQFHGLTFSKQFHLECPTHYTQTC